MTVIPLSTAVHEKRLIGTCTVALALSLLLSPLAFSQSSVSTVRQGDDAKDDSTSGPPVENVTTKRPEIAPEIYYRNKVEFSIEGGWLPINIPFPLDFLTGDPYDLHPLRYTLVPIIAGFQWHLTNVGGPWILRGNCELTVQGTITAIPRGPETHYLGYVMGIRRNFVPHNEKVAPYFDLRFGVGGIDAKGPKGVLYGQGENYPEFNMNSGSGVRINFGRYAFTAGLNYMHLSNMDLSEHKPSPADPHWGPINYGINVLGPMIGIEMQLDHRQRPTGPR